jgi:segregation and condensation protein B
LIVSMSAPLEALLFAAGSDGLSTEEIAEILQLSLDETKALCAELQQAYDARLSGLAVVELADTWQLVTRAEHASYLRRMATSPIATNLSAAALEVLAIVAYQQPVSRIEIETIRGVQSDRVVQTLVHRQLITEVGRMDKPGRPILYGTTENFLQTFGLRNLNDLPPLPEAEEDQGDLSLFDIGPALPRD